MRAEMASPEADVMGAQAYNLVFTLHGALLAVGFALPAILATLGLFVVPLQIGARAIALPWLGVASLWLYWAAIGLLVRGVWVSSNRGIPASDLLVPATVGIALAIVLVALVLFVTVLRRRAPGLTWGRLPLFAWACQVTAGGVLLAAVIMVGLAIAVGVRAPEVLGQLGQVGLAVIPGLALVPALGVVC